MPPTVCPSLLSWAVGWRSSAIFFFPVAVVRGREREGLCDIQDWGTYLLYGRLLSPETKWKAKQDPRLMTALSLFSPGGVTTLSAAFLGDFEVPLLLIAELMSFWEFENSLFSSFPTVKCYMLTFYSAHNEFRDIEMTGISLHILLWFSQLKNAYLNPTTATLPGDVC